MTDAHTTDSRSLKRIYIALIILLGVTVEVARWDLGQLNFTVTMLIAMMKAGLIMTVFMHLNQRSALVILIALASVFWLAVMLTLTFTDYSTRNWL